MKNILGSLKTYLPTILYSVLGLVALFILYKIILRLRGGGLAIGGIVADKAENKVISNETGISTSRVQELRTIASNLATEMETAKDLEWYWKLKHIVFDTDIVEICNNIHSATEMVVVKNFYVNIFTNSRNLYNDLKEEISQSNLNKIQFISAIK